MSLKVVILLLFQLIALSVAQAGHRWQAFKNWIDSADIVGTDTNYVYLPKEGFIGAIGLKAAGARLNLSQDLSNGFGREQSLSGSFSSRLAVVSIGLHYRGWGWTFSRDLMNPGDYEFSYCSYGQTRGAEFRIHSSNEMTGNLHNNASDGPDSDTHVGPGMLRKRVTLFNYYHVFNHEYFSLPAAMTQTVIQRRSSGSWLVAANYHHTHLRLHGNLLTPIVNFNNLSLSQFCIGGGYAYNYVFSDQRFLLHGSLMPMVSLGHRNRFYYGEDTERLHQQQRFSVNANAHVSIIYNFFCYVAGASSIYNLDSMHASHGFSLEAVDWTTNIFFGLRF